MLDRLKHICGICSLRAAALIDRLLGQRRPKRCILVVDDIPDVVEVMSLMLQDAEYEVHVAADGVEALRLAGELRPDLTLMNFLMPRMDGLEALARLKKDPILRNLKVVIHSARGHHADFRERTVELGALECLTKPFSKQQLLEVVHRALSG